ncbi:serine/threonine protein kinase [Limnoglobus roseus]|uniref:non-specific serine/threonine protein kinase n=2 Tax=Limnoglobus roseus TaxID=2598579 RepID=A0A5C1AEJ0_9BACT|nr:serine/threonine protein kinase [Limnoglobus roseus]
MGVVYLARQAGLNRPVALKMLLGGVTSAPAKARFLAEAEAMAAVHHPNVAQVYAYGEHGGGPYLAIELLDGGHLGERLDRLDRSRAEFAVEVATLLAGVAEGVAAAHAVGVVHRDLKPGNVLLDEAGGVKVTDFGLAKRDRGVDLTTTQAVMGTPGYMAPEQARGGTKWVGPTADVWSLGVMLFEALAGRRPFTADSTFSLIAAVAEGNAPRLRAVAPRVPGDLATVCDKCLEKAAADRYPTAAELAGDLRRFAAGEPVTARPLPVRRQIARWVRKNRAAAAGVVAAAVALVGLGVGGVALAAYKSLEADRAKDQLIEFAERERVRADVERRLAEARRLRESGRLDDARAEYVALLALAERGQAAPPLAHELTSLEAELGERKAAGAAREALAQLRRSRDEAFFFATLFTGNDPAENRAKAAAAATAGLAQFLTIRDPPPVRLADPGRFGHLSRADRDEAATVCQELLLVLAETRPDCLAAADLLPGGISVRGVATRLTELSKKRGDRPAADAYQARAARLTTDHPADLFATALAAYRRDDLPTAVTAADAVEQTESNHFWALYLGGVARVRSGEMGRAAEAFTACLALRPDFDLARVYRAFAHGEQMAFARAFADYDAALARTADPLVRFLGLNNRGIHRMAAGDLAGAEADLRGAIALRPTVAAPYRSLATACWRRGDAAAATTVLTEAIGLSPGMSALYLDRGRVLAAARPTAAREDFAAVLALKPGPDVVAETELEVARLDRRSAPKAALAAVDRALAAVPNDPAAHRLRASVLAEQGQSEDAVKALDEYLRLAGAATAADYVLQALLQAQQRRYPDAIAAYTLALNASATPADRAVARLGRAGVYLLTDAPKLAVVDYEAVVAADPKNADARCGRAEARVKVGLIAAGLADAEEAARGTPTARQWLLIARTRALARQRLTTEAGLAKQNDLPADDGVTALAAVAAAVRGAVAATPVADRNDFWQARVKPDPVLAPLLRYDLFQQIERSLAGPPEPSR